MKKIVSRVTSAAKPTKPEAATAATAATSSIPEYLRSSQEIPTYSSDLEPHHSYLVLYREENHIAYEPISLSRRPKGKPKDVAIALASILGLDQSRVIGVLHILPGVEVRLSKCGMEMLFKPYER